jgi:HlyD family secretion protein
MDRPIEKKFLMKFGTPILVGSSIFLLALLWLLAIPTDGKTLSIDLDGIQIAEVTEGVFEDFIPVRGQIMPLRTVYLDSIDGGRVEAIHLEDGSEIQKGAAIVDISNSSLQLNAFSLETQVSEQLFNMQTQELKLTQNQLTQKRDLSDVSYQILQAESKLLRMRPLLQSGGVRVSEVKDIENEFDYLTRKKKLMMEANKADQELQVIQMKSIRESVSHLQGNLQYAKNNLANLNVKAPIGGRLTAFNLEVGQSIKPGERFGQIDDPVHVKLMAVIDEFYLPRVFIGQIGEVEFQEKIYQVSVRKIYPQVTKGQFQIDLIFDKVQPEGTHRGQSMQVRIQLGDSVKSLLIPTGSFYQDTGGSWIYILEKNQKVAIKRFVKLGRRNSHAIEVLEGLGEGDQVIVSSYADYGDFEKLNLTSIKAEKI